MGMDVYGIKPTGQRGEYFRNNAWWWGPLATYCNMIAPDICAPCKGWNYNDGDGLDAAGAVALAEGLQKEIDSGRTEAFARRYASDQEMMPDEPCKICGGTGVRKPPPEPKPDADPNDLFPDLVEEFDPRKHSGAGDLKEGGIKCNGCQGSGYVRPSICHFPFSTENVADFMAFLRESGGFVIW